MSVGHSRRFFRSAGVTLPELLVVVTIIALGALVSVPLITEHIRLARTRAATNQYVMSLRAARMIAVTRRAPVTVTVATTPDNYYEYVDTYDRIIHVNLPQGTEIVAGSAIEFLPNGSVTAESETIIESVFADIGVERWTINTNRIGVTTVEHERVQ